MANELWGPLAGLIGTWESDFDGLDVSFHNVEGKIAETPYREMTTFKPFGPVDNGDQCLYGLDYRTAAWRRDEELPFHTEVGYWMWDAANKQVTRCFVIPRAQTLIAITAIIAAGFEPVLAPLGLPQSALIAAANASRAEALMASRCAATVLNAGNELRAGAAGCRQVGVVQDIGTYLGTVVAALETEDRGVRDTRTRFIDVVRATASLIVAGKRSDLVVGAAKELLGLDDAQAHAHLACLRDPVCGLTPSGVIDQASLDTLIELRRRYLPAPELATIGELLDTVLTSH